MIIPLIGMDGRSYSRTDGIKALADGLKHCTHLHTLNLSRNRIDSEGAKAPC